MASGIIYSDEYKAEFFKFKWTLTFCLWPVRTINGSFLWLTTGYCRARRWTGMPEHGGHRNIWMTKQEYIFALLKEEI